MTRRPIKPLDRRRFLSLAAGGVGAAALGLTAGCSGSDAESSGGQSATGKLTWWDHTSGNKELLQPIFAAFEQDSGLTVEYTYYQASKMAQTLQLARSSKELPDVHTIAGLQLPLSQLVADGWFQPLQLSDKDKELVPAESQVSGVNVFEDKLYGFPTNGSRFFNANTWFNKDLVAKAGLDPENPPATYDEFRTACQKIKDLGTPAKGLILNTGATLNLVIDNLAQSAGFEGANGTLFKTAEIEWHDDSYVEVVEFIMSLHRDKHVVEGKFTSDTARPRWMIGQAAYMIDGIWIPGTVKSEQAEFLDKVGVGAPLTANPGQEALMYRGSGAGTYFISKESKQPKEASALIGRLLGEDYQLAQVRKMAQAPINLELLEDSEVHESFRKPVQLAAKRCFLTPQLARQDPELAGVMAKVPPAKPGIKEIIEGLISGQVKDARKALKQLSDQESAVREKALSKAGYGADDLAFPSWKPEQDFTEDMYS